jgi:hypothetical protein
MIKKSEVLMFDGRTGGLLMVRKMEIGEVGLVSMA